ncbi:MAG: hypothetical protein AVDCRST_MAG49-4163, partial [uncultured Thermomicrobiales bacterium]
GDDPDHDFRPGDHLRGAHARADPPRAAGAAEGALPGRPFQRPPDDHGQERDHRHRADPGAGRHRAAGRTRAARLGRRRAPDGRGRRRAGLLGGSLPGLAGGLPGDHGADGRGGDGDRAAVGHRHGRSRHGLPGDDGRRPRGPGRLPGDPDRDRDRRRRPGGSPPAPRPAGRALLRRQRHPAPATRRHDHVPRRRPGHHRTAHRRL